MPTPSSASLSPSPLQQSDLRLLRLARGLSLDDAAKQVGVSPPYLSLIEDEKRPLPLQLELRLLRLLWGKPR